MSKSRTSSVRSRRPRNRKRRRTRKASTRAPPDKVPPSLSTRARASQPTVALLFLTVGDHEQCQLWNTFLNDPVYGPLFSVYCHPKTPEQVASDSFLRGAGHTHDGVLPKSARVPWPYTRWAHLTLAYYSLLHRALADPDATHQRFVFLSDTCVPCVPVATAYKALVAHPAQSYYTTQDPAKDSDRYDGVDKVPSKSVYPPQRRSRTARTVACSDVLARAGVKREHFFKHSGWFALCRTDALRLRSCRSAFQALNHVSAGDEHILSILKRRAFAQGSSLVRRPITMAFWDATEADRKEYERMYEERRSGDIFWNTHHHTWSAAQRAEHDAKWNRLKELMYHPRSFDTVFPDEALRQCLDAGSLFVRKVRQGCDVTVLKKALSDDAQTNAELTSSHQQSPL